MPADFILYGQQKAKKMDSEISFEVWKRVREIPFQSGTTHLYVAVHDGTTLTYTGYDGDKWQLPVSKVKHKEVLRSDMPRTLIAVIDETVYALSPLVSVRKQT